MDELAIKYLRDAFGQDATFKEGQLETILSVLKDKKELVVQQTGWGKSIIYFILTNIYRSNNMGPTIIISPLLSLVRNQIYSATKFNLNAVSLSSDNRDDWESIYESIEKDIVDIIFLTPEHLANNSYMDKLNSLINKEFGLLVIDEAHCISDWGHDFRPDYKKIVKFINKLNYEVPILATTATANNRVIEDIVSQLNVLNISRGPLIRESLRIQLLDIKSKQDRYAWILGYLRNSKSNGIVYCLTKKDTIDLNNFLVRNGINSMSYNADTINREEVETSFLNNKIDCLVATIALGMGYDKGDIGFIIHYQRPGNVVAYYQQIGRAGRSLDQADIIMLNGLEDERIQRSFIDDAFPKVEDIKEVLSVISKIEDFRFRGYKVLELVNIKKSKVDQILKYLCDNDVLLYDNAWYSIININTNLDFNIFDSVTKERYKELEEMKEFSNLKTCYMKYLATKLSDSNASDCGKCANCLNKDIYNSEINSNDLLLANSFVSNIKYMIEPRKQLPIGVKYYDINKLKTTKYDYLNEIGYSLTSYGDNVLSNRIEKMVLNNELLSNDIVDMFAKLIKDNTSIDGSYVITYVPSNHHNIVLEDLAKRIGEILNIEYEELIVKNNNSLEQHNYNNAYKWFDNAIYNYNVNGNIVNKNIILIDDTVISKWTLTAIGFKLKLNNANKVFPFTLTMNSYN